MLKATERDHVGKGKFKYYNFRYSFKVCIQFAQYIYTHLHIYRLDQSTNAHKVSNALNFITLLFTCMVKNAVTIVVFNI